MLSSLLRPRKGRRRIEHSPFSSPFNSSPQDVRERRRGRPEATSDEEHENPEEEYTVEGDQTYGELNEDEDDEPLLPIFSAAHLDILPVYDITHTIRMLIIQKCETTLSWEQLRTPQIAQFLIKPLELQIKAHHFNRSTLLALIANCLQFKKEAETNLGHAGVNKTRALFAELLAMRLLREYSTRELIDALSYDFDPLQGMAQHDPRSGKTGRSRVARISTLEIAIRATAKRFLAHPLVVQQLEAIWAGSIVFHSAADNLHRRPVKNGRTHFPKVKGYGTLNQDIPVSPRAGPVNSKPSIVPAQSEEVMVRRSVTLYDPQDASLFKLSRLRVPRYRQLFSTLSFAVMLVLFLAVLIERSLTISPLEIAFWIYSIGYMLDEVVGFTEQGFGLYIISVWNAFDLGILLLFFTYYILRLYGILVPVNGKHRIANMAYDVLASTAVLLFPRAFSVLDHYRYFSQLLIAFRLMAQDLVAILVLIVISVSGFFVAFVLAFKDESTSSGNVAYAVFQLLMGFTPAAWAVWDQYNILGRVVLTLFLFITHFLVIVILTTVLTNSFMAIVQNANEEHQFLFAVNTISMVKSDALFSYIAPTNVLSWTISPLRFIMPFRQFVKLNRTIIKITHFPILFAIFAYEKVILSRIAYEPTDLVKQSIRGQAQPVAFGGGKRKETFQHRSRLREPSVISFRKDQALDEVFRRPFKSSTLHAEHNDVPPEGARRGSSNVVDTWMHNVGQEGGASPPMEQPRSILDRLEGRNRPGFRRALTTDRVRSGHRDFSAATRTALSDPEDISGTVLRRPKMIEEETDADISVDSIAQGNDGDDGDDELMTHDEAELATVEQSSRAEDHTPHRALREGSRSLGMSPSEYFVTPTAISSARTSSHHEPRSRPGTTTLQAPDSNQSRRARRFQHDRHPSSSTILFQPQPDQTSSSEAPQSQRVPRPQPSRFQSSSQLEPRARNQQNGSRLRPGLLTRATDMDARPGSALPFSPRPIRAREPSFNTIALDLASDLGDNRFALPIDDIAGIDGVPASLSEQLIREREVIRRVAEERRRSEMEQKEVLSRMVLNRMGTLEDGFREMLSVVRDLKEGSSRAGTGSERGDSAILSGHDRPKSRGLGTALAASTGTVASGGSRAPARSSEPQQSKEKTTRSPKKLRKSQFQHEAPESALKQSTSREDDFNLADSSNLPRVVTLDETGAETPAVEHDHTMSAIAEHQTDDQSPSSVRSIVREIDRRSSGSYTGVSTASRAGTGLEAAAGAQGRASQANSASYAAVVAEPRSASPESKGDNEDEQAGISNNRRSVIFIGKSDGSDEGAGHPSSGK